MDLAIATKLSSLPPLSRDHTHRRTCKICGSPSPIFDIVDFNKHCSSDPYEYGVAQVPVNYYRCAHCQLIFTDFIDDWTVDEISRFIYNDDYVKVDPEYLGARPHRTAVHLSNVLRGCERLRILDYGSGAGVFASDMAAFGYDKITCYDPFSHPEKPNGTFDLITCFEVIEHSPQPMETLREMTGMLSDDGAILIGQTTQPADIDQLRGAWWYIAPRNGHVSTFSTFTFFEMARREGLSFRPGAGLYAFARSAPNRAVESVLARIGPKYEGRVFLAPAENGGDPEQWHALEWAGEAPFRWTASAEVDFGAHELDAGVTRLEIPFIMEGRPEFASKCVVAIDGGIAPTRIENGKLVVEITLADKGVHVLDLRTPEPISPHALSGDPDRRPLGLAVRQAL
jgi:SAM-dependent methyltransferase